MIKKSISPKVGPTKSNEASTAPVEPQHREVINARFSTRLNPEAAISEMPLDTASEDTLLDEEPPEEWEECTEISDIPLDTASEDTLLDEEPLEKQEEFTAISEI